MGQSEEAEALLRLRLSRSILAGGPSLSSPLDLAIETGQHWGGEEEEGEEEVRGAQRHPLWHQYGAELPAGRAGSVPRGRRGTCRGVARTPPPSLNVAVPPSIPHQKGPLRHEDQHEPWPGTFWADVV